MPDPNEAQAGAASPDAGTPPGESGQQPAPQGGAPEQFLEVGGAKYAPDQAKELIELGQSMKQLKEKYPDVDFAGMVPTFTQQRQLLSDPQKLAQYYQQTFAQQQQAVAEGQLDPNDPEIQKVSKILQGLGFMTKSQYDEQQRQADFNSKLDALEESLDGSDGKPKFDRTKVLDYMQKNPVYDPLIAYKAMNEEQLQEWYAAKKVAAKPKGVTSERGGAGIPIVTSGKAPKFGTPEFQAQVDKVLGESAE